MVGISSMSLSARVFFLLVVPEGPVLSTELDRLGDSTGDHLDYRSGDGHDDCLRDRLHHDVLGDAERFVRGLEVLFGSLGLLFRGFRHGFYPFCGSHYMGGFFCDYRGFV